MESGRGLALLMLVVSAVLLEGCAGVSEQQAQATALDFVKSRVKFYSQDPNYAPDQAQYEFKFINSSLAGGRWVFFLNASASRQNETKSAVARIAVDSTSGQVVDFGQIR